MGATYAAPTAAAEHLLDPELATPCRAGDPEDWYPAASDTEGQRAAVQACQDCPVIQECLDLALALERTASAAGRFGVWGGMTPQARASLSRSRARLERIARRKGLA